MTKTDLYWDKIRPRWYIIQTSKTGPHIIWYNLVMFCAVLNAIWTPFSLSFDYTKKLAEDDTRMFYWMDVSTNIIFTIDLIVQFFSSYIDIVDGVEVYKPSLIAKHYLGTEFLFDFVSTMPWRRIGVIFGWTGFNY